MQFTDSQDRHLNEVPVPHDKINVFAAAELRICQVCGQSFVARINTFGRNHQTICSEGCRIEKSRQKATKSNAKKQRARAAAKLSKQAQEPRADVPKVGKPRLRHHLAL